MLGGKHDGWLVFGMYPGRIDVARVVRREGARPRIAALDSFARDGDDIRALVALRKRLKLQRQPATTLLDSSAYQLVQVDAPGVPDDEMTSALRWSLKDSLGYPVENATIAAFRIPVEQSSGRPQSVFAVTANNERLAPCIQMFDAAGLDLKVVDIPELAQRNVAALFEEANRGLAFLYLNEAGGLLTITYRGELYAVRRVELSATQLAEADEERRGQLFERVMLELQRTLDNFDRQYGFISVVGMILAAYPEVPALQPYLAENLYIPVQAMDLASVCDCSAVPELRDPAQQARHLHLIGAGLRTPGVA